MAKFFPKFGGNKQQQKGSGTGNVERPEPKNLEDEILAEIQREAEEDESYNYSSAVEEEEEEEEDEQEEEDEVEEYCQDDDEECLASSTLHNMAEDSTSSSNNEGKISSGYLGGSSTTVTAISITLALVLLGWNLLFRRKQRRQLRIWKKDSQKILTRVEDVMLQLEDRDEQVDLLQQKMKLQQAEATKEQQRITNESTNALDLKEKECQQLKQQIAELQAKQKETDNQLERVATELKHSLETQQDHECQLLEQKLQANQLSTALGDRDVLIESLQQSNAKLQQKIKADAHKAEKIIGELTSERDERYGILQQENEAIKTTVMGMLKQTQERYDADKILLKKEMRTRDDKIRSLQEELWNSNSLLKKLGGEKAVKANLSQSTRNLIDKKETKEKTARRSSTYDAAETILEDTGKSEEVKQLEKMLQ